MCRVVLRTQSRVVGEKARERERGRERERETCLTMASGPSSDSPEEILALPAPTVAISSSWGEDILMPPWDSCRGQKIGHMTVITYTVWYYVRLVPVLWFHCTEFQSLLG